MSKRGRDGDEPELMPDAKRSRGANDATDLPPLAKFAFGLGECKVGDWVVIHGTRLSGTNESVGQVTRVTPATVRVQQLALETLTNHGSGTYACTTYRLKLPPEPAKHFSGPDHQLEPMPPTVFRWSKVNSWYFDKGGDDFLARHYKDAEVLTHESYY